MRAVPPSLAAALESGTTTLCHCWLLTRRDGVQLGLTDHDRNITIGAMTFEAASGFTASALESEAGLATGGGEIAGALSSERIDAGDIEAGLYDGAEIRTYLVDWCQPALDFHLATTTIGDIKRMDGRFVAETRDAFHALDQERGRLYAATCDCTFGDARCGLDISAPPHRMAATVLSAPERTRIFSNGAAAKPSGHFTRGHVRFLGGTNAGVTALIKDHRDGGELVLWQALSADALAGDAIELVAGCDKRFATCRDRFDNAVNFQGFPFIPAPETVLSYARPGEGRHRGRPLVR